MAVTTAREDKLRAALDKYLAADTPGETGWWDAFCPVHPDDKRSAGFNFDSNRWRCHGCGGSGSLTSLVRQLQEEHKAEPASIGGFADPDAVLASVTDIATRKRTKGEKVPPPNKPQIAAWTEALLADNGHVSFFKKQRGISADTIRQFDIGWDGRRYTLPVYSPEGELLNVRSYNPDSETKMYHWAGMSPQELYPQVHLALDEIMICEGELDALLATQKGFPAITGTSGAKNWNKKWNQHFEGKVVYVCFDRDSTGDAAAAKVVTNLKKIAKALYVIELPLPWREKHGLDVTDYFVTYKKSAKDFRKLRKNARLMSQDSDELPVEVPLASSYDPKLVGRPVTMTVTTVGKDESPHTIPRQIEYTCDMSAGKVCATCPMSEADGHMSRTIEPGDRALLEMRHIKDAQVDNVLRSLIEANPCRRLKFDKQEFYNLTTVAVRPNVDRKDEREGDTTNRYIVAVTEGEVSSRTQTVRVTGTVLPSPHSQETTFLAWDMEPVETSLDNFILTEDDKRLLEKFKPSPGQSPLDKLREVAEDLAANVTHITGRPELHMAQMLVFTSLIDFKFNGRPLDRGWLELLVVGDSRTGKSEVASKLVEHFGVGTVVSCESASIPGILGAVKQQGGGNKGWTLEWGTLPVNDRRLLVLDEVSGLPVSEIGKLSSVRSSGRAEIVKATTHSTHARVRQIWLSNPRHNTEGMSTFMFGVEAVKPLIGHEEDIARFDFAMAVLSGEVASEDINAIERRTVPHVYDAQSCNLLARLAWSRKRADVKWERGTEELVLKMAQKMGKLYVPRPPLVQAENVRDKIARLVAALATVTGSYDAKWEKVIITKEHVRDAVRLMNRLYASPVFGYHQLSDRHKEEERTAVEHMEEAKTWLKHNRDEYLFLLRCGGEFLRSQVEEQLAKSREETNAFINKFSKWNMIKGEDNRYRMTKWLNIIVREIHNEH